MRPFSASELARGAHALHRAATRAARRSAAAGAGGATADVATANVEPGQPSITTRHRAAGRRSHHAAPAGDRERAPDKLRATMLTMTFDGEETVRVPLVDFFGTGPGVAAYASLPMTIGEDGAMTCRFPMPFRERAEIRISRQTPGAVDIRGDVSVEAGAVFG